MIDIMFLKDNKIFPFLKEDDLRLLLKYSKYQNIRKGKVLYYQSDKADNLFAILGGTIQKIKYRADESTIVLGKVYKGDWLGITEVLIDSLYLYDTITIEATKLLSFSKTNFTQLLKIDNFKNYILTNVAKQHYLLHNQLELNQPLSRLINFLLNTAKLNKNNKYILYTTQEDLAESIGVTRETVNKHLNRFQQAGLINIFRGSIEIIDKEGLEIF